LIDEGVFARLKKGEIRSIKNLHIAKRKGERGKRIGSGAG